MLIRVVVPAPHPTVLFSLDFRDLNDRLPTPPGWAAQIAAVHTDELELPRYIHAFDKAAGIPSLLEHVTFDLIERTVESQYQDGTVEQWPLERESLLASLQDVLSDIRLSAAAAEQEKRRERMLKQRRRESKRPKVTSVPHDVRPKTKRLPLLSWFLSIVASKEFSICEPDVSIEDVRQEHEDENVIPLPPLSSRVLRRRARSTLVNTFRLHVLTELRRRFSVPDYYTWVLRSMFQRSAYRMLELVAEHEGCIPQALPDRLNSYFSQCSSPHFAESVAIPSSPSLDDGDDADSDTDGSSVHTPSASHFRLLGSLATSPSGRFSLFDKSSPKFAEYKAFAEVTLRLRHLLLCAQEEHAAMEMELKQISIILEIGARRRAWSDNALKGSSYADMGLSAPSRSSPLARYMWSGDDYEYAPDHEEYVELGPLHVGPQVCEADRAHLVVRRFRSFNVNSDNSPPMCEVQLQETNNDTEISLASFALTLVDYDKEQNDAKLGACANSVSRSSNSVLVALTSPPERKSKLAGAKRVFRRASRQKKPQPDVPCPVAIVPQDEYLPDVPVSVANDPQEWVI
ncbi:hypothetical protein FISHEDRAFT_72355 [Fistulina hepatica ATCC 64428]|uniref:Uncharacterized protein n=1 Tax=Fistulina hepatica ATCC 64428 TaxID=1128425 RepID=A0A0D7AHB7_9AGAR|nr:hypothetical protein FISHEDRAFT_72355 [Fistulina hepatica ATCC 64428]